jgi:hypothetical protein
MSATSRKRKKAICPPIGALMRDRDRTVCVVAEASCQRAVIESIDVNGRPFRSVVKWANLAGLNEQLF